MAKVRFFLCILALQSYSVMKEIYFAAGCFWGAQHFFSKVGGVQSATAGYANGHTPNPSYEQVYTDTTGHAETVRVRYSPERVSLAELVRLFFTVIDPLSLNRQGGDKGTRYRTGVYYTSEDDRPVIEAVFAARQAALPGPLAVELKPLECFFEAEERHQDYLGKNPGGYCHVPLKSFRYLSLYQDLKLMLEGESDGIARMAVAAALIQGRMHFFWTGFYRVADGVLVLGPFQGPEACMRIGYGKGVCGTAWKEDRTVVVPDVEKFPGHIACSRLSRSEIVVPLHEEGRVSAVLDIDSTEEGTFDEVDAIWLEMIAELLA